MPNPRIVLYVTEFIHYIQWVLIRDGKIHDKQGIKFDVDPCSRDLDTLETVAFEETSPITPNIICSCRPLAHQIILAEDGLDELLELNFDCAVLSLDS